MLLVVGATGNLGSDITRRLPAEMCLKRAPAEM